MMQETALATPLVASLPEQIRNFRICSGSSVAIARQLLSGLSEIPTYHFLDHCGDESSCCKYCNNLLDAGATPTIQLLHILQQLYGRMASASQASP